MASAEVTYWAARAAEERRLAATLPEGPAAIVHRQLAELYEEEVREAKESPPAPARHYGRSNIRFASKAPVPWPIEA